MRSMFELITSQVIDAIQSGADNYRMPWHHPEGLRLPSNAITGRSYRGINTLVLWTAAERAGCRTNKWATYQQWAQNGAQVRKGERSTTVFLWKPVGQGSAGDDDAGDTRSGSFVARAFRVFNADQVDGFDAVEPAAAKLDPSRRIDRAEAFFGRVPASIWHGSDSAFYDSHSDTVSMPSFEAFISPDAFYSVLSHELVHWTGSKQRLDRDLSGRFGSAAYAMEELVAELGAAFLTGHLGLGCEPRTDHAPYIKTWLRVLGGDPKAIVTAASRAQAAADYIIALAGETAGDPGKAASADTSQLVEAIV